MKVFISLSMNGRADQVIKDDQQKYLKDLEIDMREKEMLTENEHLDLVDTVTHQNIPANASRLWYLGEAIKKLSDADIVLFAGDWYKARGCWVEFAACVAYDKKMFWDFPKSAGAARAIENVVSIISAFVVKKGIEDENNKRVSD